MKRPAIAEIASGAELRRWYWLKDELIGEARRVGVKSSGGKFEILNRICDFRDSGQDAVRDKERKKTVSRFDWHCAALDPSTLITDNYKNTQNVRRFFRSQTDLNFKFNIAFMEWMKANTGKTLADAVTAYRAQRGEAAAPGYQTRMKTHNQFNQYTRDFLADNPQLGMADVRKYWKLKRAMPSDDGRHAYDPGDFKLAEE